MGEAEAGGSREPAGDRSASSGSGGTAAASDLTSVAEEAAATLDVERVSVWLFEEGRAALRRVHLYDRGAGVHRSGGVLSHQRFPTYFRSLLDEGGMAVERVGQDPRTRELAAPYARPLDIVSWLDVPVPGGEESPAGFLRLEQVGRSRTWEPDDTVRAREAAAAAAHALDPGPETRRPPDDGGVPPGASADENPAGVAALEPDGTLVWCNPAFAGLLGHAGAADELRGADVAERHWGSEGDWRELVGRLRRSGRLAGEEVRVRTAGGSGDRWLLVSSALREAGGEGTARVLVTAQDITDRREREEELRHQAGRDPLTGLANRRLLRETAERTLALAERHGRAAGLLYLDLTGFKEVNDSHGHHVGDLVLGGVADRLREVVRESDLAARVGGDEFVVLLSEVDGADGARRAGERLREVLRRPVRAEGVEVRVEGEVGVALYPDHGSSLEELMSKADRAMYRSREREGADVLVHGSGDAAPGPDAPSAEALRRALDEGQLRLYYQPIVRLPDRETVGAEALLRWRHPERGLVPAGRFLAAAREGGLLPRIDRWVLGRAVLRAGRWHASGRDRWLAVNVGVESLAEGGLPTYLDGLVAERGLRRDRLLVEATVAPGDAELGGAVPALRNIRAKSFRVALDCGGPVEELGAAVRDVRAELLKVESGGEGGGSVRSLAQALGAEVLLKRVETERDYRTAEGRGVPLVQGFFTGRPVPADDLEEAD